MQDMEVLLLPRIHIKTITQILYLRYLPLKFLIINCVTRKI